MTQRFRHFSPLAFLAILLIFTPCVPANAAEMKAGVAKADITPPLGVQMWGYFDRVKGDQGILDPLYARVLVLEAGDKRLAYVDLDLGGVVVRPSGTAHALRA